MDPVSIIVGLAMNFYTLANTYIFSSNELLTRKNDGL